MSLAFIAAAKLLGLPGEVVEQLPELFAQLPEVVATATELVTTANERVTNIEASLARIERKLNALGTALIAVMEKNDVSKPDALTAGTSDGSRSGNHSAANGTAA